MHILFLTDNFPPEVNAPASRTFEHCQCWVEAGHEVTVITCAPNFPKGHVFPGYANRLWQSEKISGIRVIRVWSYISANEGFFKRILDYLSYMFAAIVAAIFVRRVDVVIGTSPQFFTACAAYVVGLYKRVPYVFELRDLWPESIKVVGALRQSILLIWLERLELFLYRRSAAIVSVTHSFRQNLIARGIDHRKIFVITNGVDTSKFEPREKDLQLTRQLELEGKFVLGYIGTHGMAHCLETILDAAAKLQNILKMDQYVVLFLGDGASKKMLVQKASDLKLRNVRFVDTVPKGDVASYWSLLDVSVIHLKKDDLFTTVIPSKIFESMGMGIPILHGVAGESARIVEDAGAGIFFEAENPNSLIEGLTQISTNWQLHSQLRANGIAAAKLYDRAELAKNMLHILLRIKS